MFAQHRAKIRLDEGTLMPLSGYASMRPTIGIEVASAAGF
jgi:hypothetical protein